MHVTSYLNKSLAILLFLSLTALLLSCSNDIVVSDKRILMDTTIEIKVLGKDKDKLKVALHQAFKEVEKINNIMNYYDESSALSQLNKQAKEAPVNTDEDIYYVVDKCIKFGKMTNGAFDITATSLDRYNGFEEIILDQDNRTIYFRDSKLKIDLSAAAKGYAVDRAILVLERCGVEDALVNAGGDIRVLGRYKKRPWLIGLRNPHFKNEIALTLKLTDKAVATSGNYLRSHIIDTLKSDTKNYSVLSSTIIDSDCLSADILATSLFIMGKEGIDLVNTLEEVEALLIIEEDGQLESIETPGFYRYKASSLSEFIDSKEMVKN